MTFDFLFTEKGHRTTIRVSLVDGRLKIEEFSIDTAPTIVWRYGDDPGYDYTKQFFLIEELQRKKTELQADIEAINLMIEQIG